MQCPNHQTSSLSNQASYSKPRLRIPDSPTIPHEEESAPIIKNRLGIPDIYSDSLELEGLHLPLPNSKLLSSSNVLVGEETAGECLTKPDKRDNFDSYIYLVKLCKLLSQSIKTMEAVQREVMQQRKRLAKLDARVVNLTEIAKNITDNMQSRAGGSRHSVGQR